MINDGGGGEVSASSAQILVNTVTLTCEHNIVKAAGPCQHNHTYRVPLYSVDLIVKSLFSLNSKPTFYISAILQQY